MENDEETPDDAGGQQNRMATGIALGIPFGLFPPSKGRAPEDADPTDEDPER